MTFHDAAHERQTHAVASELLRRVESPEGRKQAAGLPHIETGPVVAHPVDDGSTFAPPLYLDERIGDPAGELERVGQQIHEHLSDERAIRRRFRESPDTHAHSPAGAGTLQLGDHLRHQRRNVQQLAHQSFPPEQRQVEQVLREMHEPVAAAVDVAQIFLLLRSEGAGRLAGQQLREADHHMQRSA